MRPIPAAALTPGDEFQQRAHTRIAERLVQVRLLIAPVFVAIGVLVAWADAAPWRRAVLWVTPAVLLAASWYAAARVRRHGIEPHTVDVNLVLNVFGQVFMVVGTGGVESPLAPTFLLLGLLVTLVASKRVALAMVLGVQVPVLVTLTVLQARGHAPSLLPLALVRPPYTAASPALLAWRAAALVFFLTAVAVLGRVVRGMFTEMLREMGTAREGQLDAHLEQHRTLTTLTGEIAHELKNPLATVKGLGALLARSLEGKNAERLAVLRREVDRMEHTLDEFLNFSRPLVPLTLESVDLTALAREVLALHEGMAAERGVRLELEDRAEVPVRCDPRKVRQVLVNVLQNALDAAPRGSVVRVSPARVDGPAPGARLRVRDEGPGVPPGVAERAFEAGVTTKARGSGLGLTVARALARQHGGELSLADADGGGCVAEITLPAAPPVADARAVGVREASA